MARVHPRADWGKDPEGAMTAVCDHCHTAYDVDEARVPAGGIETLCRECGGRFWIRRALGSEPTALHLPGLPQIPGYSVVRLLGKGGMATVYLGREQASDREIAIKLMHGHLVGDPSARARFLRETRAISSLSHPNILEVVGCGEHEGILYLASELAAGGTLEHYLDLLEKLPAPVVVLWAVDMLAGLGFAHERGMIHRDVKPANLLLVGDGALRVGDFGIAKTQGGATLTQTGALLGTPAYMSPEQASGQPLDGRSDLYSVGIVLYQLLSGENPYQSDQATTSLARVLKGAGKCLFEVEPTVPPALERVVERLMERDPARRYQRAADALVDLGPQAAAIEARYPDLRRGFVAEPGEWKRRLCTEQAEQHVAQARRLVQRGPSTQSQAALLLYRAVLLCPEHEEASALLEQICTSQKLSFDEVSGPKVVELEQALADKPDSPGILQRLAQLCRAQGNLHRAAGYYKRYLKLRPNDGYAAGQLSLLTGESQPGLALGASGPMRAHGEPGATAHFAGGAEAAAAPGFAEPGGPGAIEIATLDHETPSAPAQVVPVGGMETLGDVQDSPETEARTPAYRVSTARVLWDAWGKRILVVLLIGGAIIGGVIWIGDAIDSTSVREGARIERLSQGAGGLSERLGRLKGVLAQRQFPLGRVDKSKRDAQLAAMTLDSAMRRFRAGSYRGAIPGFDIIIDRYPESSQAVQARFFRGRALFEAGAIKQAFLAFDAFLKRHPGDSRYAEALLRRAQAQAKLGNHQAAIADLSVLLRDHSASPLVNRAYLARARSATATGAFRAARADLRQVLSRTAAGQPLYTQAKKALKKLPTRKAKHRRR